MLVQEQGLELVQQGLELEPGLELLVQGLEPELLVQGLVLVQLELEPGPLVLGSWLGLLGRPSPLAAGLPVPFGTCPERPQCIEWCSAQG